MLLRGSPTEKEYKEKLNRKKERKRKLRLGIVSKPPCNHNKILFFL
jgi:hypothetical protein